MTLAIVGSRVASDAQRAEILAILTTVAHDAVVTGDAGGVDEVARQWARTHQLPLAVHAADWAQYGRAGGPIRNALVVRDADRMLAFVCRWPSPGTVNACEQARGKGIEVVVKDLTGAG